MINQKTNGVKEKKTQASKMTQRKKQKIWRDKPPNKDSGLKHPRRSSGGYSRNRTKKSRAKSEPTRVYM